MSDRHDLSAPPDLSHKRQTGASRLQRPEYVSLMPPCNDACPAGENIQAWLSLAQAGKFREAWEQILQDNPLPAVHGRICYHPCETGCNRAQLDGAVSIHAVERFLGDKALAEGWTPAPPPSRSGRKVLVVGAGPSGLSCAHHLSMLGHDVEIRDAGPVAGGMMHFGIPAYRLPRDVLDGEVDRIRRQGVKITLNHKVDDLAREKEEGGFDAAFVAVGAHLSKRIEIPGRDAGKLYDAVGFLKGVEMGEAPKLGRRVAIYGGGNTAMDAARTAKRLGHEPMIIYRRDREHMPAHAFEADEAIEEGVTINWLRTIKSMNEHGMQVEVMEIDPETGRPRPTGEIETIEADDLILALGQETDTSFLSNLDGLSFTRDGSVEVDARMMTGAEGVFAGGDMVPSDRTATIGVGHGKKAARAIDAWLRGEAPARKRKAELASFDKLHLWFYTDVAQRPQDHLPMQRRQSSFEEVVKGLSDAEAAYEAKRCLSCGNCFECDGCLGACPEDAIASLGPGEGYKVNFDLCTGCAICFEQCPCHAIKMIPEPSPGAAG
ncbi:MAG: NAD(P)-binding protein [Rubrimonas sp.]|uniref:NAD(P)-binding protein n=1 Tax=Rubrimonas sp. TaxID=2036015 RepID=UPI002FDDAFBB